MTDEHNGTDFTELDGILSEIDSIRKSREPMSEEELTLPEGEAKRPHRFSDGNEESAKFNLDELFSSEEKTGSGDTRVIESVKSEEDGGSTRVLEAPIGHELYFSLGHTPQSSRKDGYRTEEYEPEEYGLSEDESSLSFVSRGVRQLRNVKGEAAELPNNSRKKVEHVSPAKRNRVVEFLRREIRFDVLRACFSVPLALVLLYMELYGSLSLPFPSFFADPFVFSVTALTLVAAVIGINCIPIARAVRDVFTAKATADASLPFAALAALTLVVYDLVAPSQSGVFSLLGASFALAAVFADIWRAVRSYAVLKSFVIVGSNRQKGVLVPVEDERIGRDIMGHIVADGSTVYKPERTDFISDFIKNSFSPDVSSHSALVLAFISVAVAIAAAMLSYFFGGGLRDSICSACAVFLSFTPFTSQLVFSLPYLQAVKQTAKYSSAIIGYGAAEGVNSVSAVVIDSNHLFPKGSISLDAMRTFGVLRIDDAIADAASVVCAAGGALSHIFLGVIDNDRSLLRKVDSLLYEDGLGLSAWVNERRVLVGTAELLRGHNVNVPSRDYEARYSSSGQNLVYVSVGGLLTAMFVVSYHPRQEIYDVLFELRKEKIGLVIVNRDCNITAEMINRLFDFPVKLINIMTPTNEHLLGRSMEKSCPAGIVYSKGLMGIGTTVLSSLHLASAVSFANVLQIGGILLTAALAVYLSAVGSVTQLTLTELLACQGVFGMLTALSALIHKK